MFRLLFALAAFAFGVGAVSAAEFDTSQLNGWPVISISGGIFTGDARRFEALAAAAGDHAIVDLSSGFGQLPQATRIGQYIHEHHYWTLVRTNNFCSGACAGIWVAGEHHWSSAPTHIIFRGAYAGYRAADGEIFRDPSPNGTALLGAYFARIGLTDEQISFIMPMRFDADGFRHAGGINDPISAEYAAESHFPNAIGIPVNPHPRTSSFYTVHPKEVFENNTAPSRKDD